MLLSITSCLLAVVLNQAVTGYKLETEKMFIEALQHQLNNKKLDDTSGKRSVPRAVAELLKGAKLIKKSGNYRMFGKKGGFVRAEAEFSLLRASNIVKSGNKKYGQLEDTTVVLIKERRGAMINVWKNKKRPNGVIELQKIDRIKYCCDSLEKLLENLPRKRPKKRRHV